MTELLLVEDESILRETIAEILEFQGFRVHRVASGEQALAVLDKYTPQLIISDIMMPGMSGLDLMRRVREKRPEMKYIILSALTSAEDKRLCFELGASDFITKPFRAEDLMARIKAVTEQK